MKHPISFIPSVLVAPLLLAALTLPLSLGGCTKENAGELQAATTAKSAAANTQAPPPPTFVPSTTASRPAAVPKAAEVKNAPPTEVTAPKVKYNSGEDPQFAKKRGWPVNCPNPLPGSILPQKRIVAYYGNPQSKRMGALGEFPKDDMLRRLKEEAARWEKADPSLPVLPALHLIAVVAQGEPGKAGK